MALKKRSSEQQAREAAIEAFAAGAEPIASPVSPPRQSVVASPASVAAAEATGVPTAPARPTTPVVRAIGERRSEVAMTMLLRFESEDLPRLLEEVANLEGRKKHPMALRALAIGLEVVKQGYQ